MKRLKNILLFIFVLPLTLFLDLILYAALKTCPTCESFWAWVGTEGAISFPIVVVVTEWFGRVLERFKK
ncbi:hypothetical protein A2960_06205 [Candidatus Gottesmanbacteria bacterium RIFCSPLOWO2_01_FULL_39_12b]|uniref:Uncharacterized protein n=1 Tax=Candidatus Gottesmanbacteria bacterium RIFCSPLOWO2_01_FULL_39_12b TaxID=1798388 RepID=A0A1F6AP31_9BACT|nr:MAG: hypothetical protein A2960_06205 [Candidatus Gottesmanbacteria bacterium RIFCSPLOWO2_01_FULL_39_12b]